MTKSQVLVNLCVKEKLNNINYNTSSFTINRSVTQEEKVNFQVESYVKEVKKLSTKERKKFKKIAQSFVATTMTFLTFASKSMASTSLPTTSNIGLEAVSAFDILEMMEKITQFMVDGSAILAILFLVGAGFLRMIRKKKEATDWTTDILKGFTHVLVSAPVVLLIYTLYNLILGDIGDILSKF